MVREEAGSACSWVHRELHDTPEPLVPTARSSAAAWSQPAASLPLRRVFATLALQVQAPATQMAPESAEEVGQPPAPVFPAMSRHTMLLCSANLKFLLGLEPFLLFFERHFFNL